MRKYSLLYWSEEDRRFVVFQDEGDDTWYVYTEVPDKETGVQIVEAMNEWQILKKIV